jgi:hypothetical protein
LIGAVNLALLKSQIGFIRPLFGNQSSMKPLFPSLFACWIVSLHSLHAGAQPLRVVARSGDPVPGIGEGAHFLWSDTPSPQLNSAGEVTFRADFDGVGFGRGYFVEHDGVGLTLVAREGQQAPGTAAGVTLDGFNFYPFGPGNDGRIAFTAYLDIPGVVGSLDGFGLWSADPSGVVTLVARSEAQAPDTANGVVFGTGFGSAAFNGSGQLAFRDRVSGPGVTQFNRDGIWFYGASGLELAVRGGDPTPGLETQFLTLSLPMLNDAGDMAFQAETIDSREGVWTGNSTSGFSLVAGDGLHAPGTPVGVTFKDFEVRPGFNNAGEIAFFAGLQGTGVNTSNRSGLWSEGGGSGLRIVARSGDQAPGTESGVTFGRMGSILHPNALY